MEAEKMIPDKVLEKITSARFLVTLMMMATFCFIALLLLIMFWANIDNKDAFPIIEKITMFLLGAFVTQVANIVTSYFQRSDRNGNHQLPKE